MLYFSQTVFKNIKFFWIFIYIVIWIFVDLFPAASQNSVGVGVVTSACLNIRSKPDRYSLSLMVIKKGTKVNVLEYVDGWVKVSYQGKNGYIRDRLKYIKIKKRDAVKEKPLLKKQFKKVKRQIEDKKNEIFHYSEKEAVIIEGLNDLDMKINQAFSKLNKIDQDIHDIDKQIHDTFVKINELGQRIQENEKYVCLRLVALYKLNSLGMIYALGPADSLYQLVIKKKNIEKILESDNVLVENYIKDKNRLINLKDKLDKQKQIKILLEDDYKEQIRITNFEKSKKEIILAEIKNKKQLARSAIASLEKSANKLNKTIKSLEQGSTTSNNIKKIEGSKSFNQYKGLLKIPVKGKIISFFGPCKDNKYNIVTFKNGIDIKTDIGEPVRSVFLGKVIYADWFKGYGNMIIIDHGNHYYSLYAHMEEIFKSKGDFVEKHEVIATVGETGSLTGAKLHFELRYKGKSVDPLKWFSKNLN